MINLNDFAVRVVKEEGLKESISIAQVKEVVRISLRLLVSYPLKDVVELLTRVSKKK